MLPQATARGGISKVAPLNEWRGGRQTLPQRITQEGKLGRGRRRLATRSREAGTTVHWQQHKETWFVSGSRAAKEPGMVGYVGTLAGAGIVTVGTPSGVAWMTLGLATVLALAFMTGRGRHPPTPAAGRKSIPHAEMDEGDWKEAA